MLRVTSQIQATIGCRACAVLLLLNSRCHTEIWRCGFCVHDAANGLGRSVVSNLEHNTSGAMQKVQRRATRVGDQMPGKHDLGGKIERTRFV